ncbi:MAG: UvrD-helicase domain-containing protein [Thermoanaerobaculia bacterium]|nr:UvrD-helicase domain-containing protein [Thermoanaerobaculia bacterium]
MPPAPRIQGPSIDWPTTLNEHQLAAVNHREGPQLVLAGAGSGKTRVITYRIAWLIRECGIDPAAISAVTFTNKAAGEMRERVEHLAGYSVSRPFVGTFHRFALVLLRRFGERVNLHKDFAIFDTKDQLQLVKKALVAEELSETSFSPRAVLSTISGAKNLLLSPNAYEENASDFFSRRIARVYRRYQGLLREAGAVDFDDMLFFAVRLLRQDEEVLGGYRRRLEYLLVDEFQDTNHAQLELVKILGGETPNLTAVGDEDQGIYRWRGAELDNILDFERHFPGAVVRKLEQNYRSTQTILDASGAMVENNESRRGKRLWTDEEKGDPIRIFKGADEGDEARWIVNGLKQRRDDYDLREMAVLVRTHSQTRALEEELLRQGVPYQLIGGVRFYDRAEIKDLVAYLRVLRNPRDNHSFDRIVNTPPRGIGGGTLSQLAEHAETMGVTLWDALLQNQVLDSIPARGSKALRSFRDFMLALMEDAEHLDMPELLGRLIEESGYAEALIEKDDSESRSRLENVEEFRSAAQEFSEGRPDQSPFECLTDFLDHVSLTSDLDSQQENGGVSLMTLHSAKGLEFPVVVVAGLEEGILPHFNSQETREDIEEERRLLYVGMTRAMQHLSLTCCRRRRIAGRYQDQIESSFLAEIPDEFLDVEVSSHRVMDERSREVYSFFRTPGASSGTTGGSMPSVGPPRVSSSPRPTGSPTSSGGLQQGTQVMHPTLGKGVVLEVIGSGEQGRISVFFERWGKRMLVAKYAKLDVV